MLSRVADSLYWMSRYLERAENTVRQLDVTMSLMLDTGGASAETRWQRLVAALGKPAGLEWNGSLEAMAGHAHLRQPQPCVRHLLHQRGARKCPPGARRNLDRAMAAPQPAVSPDALAPCADPVSLQHQRRAGLGGGWHSPVQGRHRHHHDSRPGMALYPPGRYLERAYATATLLEVFQPDLFGAPEREPSGYQYLEQVGLLRCCTAFEAFCQVYTADLSPDRILEFLLLNRDFPHAIRYSVDGVRQAIDSIQRTGGRRPPDELTAGIGRLHAMLGYTTIGEILAGDAAAFLHTIREQCLRIHELMYRYYVHYSIQSALAI